MIAVGFSPRKASLTKRVGFIKIDAMFFEESAILILETLVTMMLALVGDVFDDIGNGGGAHGESAVSILPCEVGFGEVFGIDPRRASAFELLDSFGDGHRLGDFDEEMDVVFDAADTDGMDLVSLGDAGEIGPDF